MRYLLTSLLILTGLWNTSAQEYLSSQSEVDAFPSNYYGSVFGGSLVISGADVTHLDSLYQLDSITGFLLIQRTSLQNLQGLHNLTKATSINLSGNNELQDISALSGLTGILGNLSINHTAIETLPAFPTLTTMRNLSLISNSKLKDISSLAEMTFDGIAISRNPGLQHCAVASICDHLISYKSHSISRNADGCVSREDVLMSCPDYDDCTIIEDSMLIDFDDWDGKGAPEGLEIVIDSQLYVDTLISNFGRGPNLGDGSGYSLRLNTFVNPQAWELVGSTDLTVDAMPSQLDISFDYCFDELINDRYQGVGSILIDGQDVWNTGFNSVFGHVPCDTPRTVKLCDIPFDRTVDNITITFENTPLYSSRDAWTYSSWYIDNISVSFPRAISISDEESPDTLTYTSVYPNPTSGRLTVSSQAVDIDYTIYNMQGSELLSGRTDSQVDLSHLPSGVYVLVVYNGCSQSTHKVVRL